MAETTSSGVLASTINDGASASLVDTIMSRLEAVDASVNDTVAHEDMKGQQDMVRAVEAWMEDVKVCAQREASRTLSSSATHGLQPSLEETATSKGIQHHDQAKEVSSIPYFLFMYLWEMQQEHDRVTVRRSALFFSSLLLQKSKDCRLYLEQESHLVDWVSNIVAGGKIWKDPDKAALHLPLLQGEALSLLSYLLDNGYGRLYPKIGVASKSLRHQCPNSNVVQVPDLGGMATWRKLRDVALLHGDEEIDRVGKLLQRANGYLEILVPRFGRGNDGETAIFTDHEKQHGHDVDVVDNDNDNDEDEESNIDWEDGDGLDDKGESMFGGTTSPEMHISAVDKTMAAMESAGTILLRGGELEIEFGAQANEGLYSNTVDDGPSSTVQNPTVRKKLEKCIQKLSQNHLPRQTAWLEGLRNADTLVMTFSSLVSMSSQSRKQRLDLVERLSELKQQITNTISSASRLRIDVMKQQLQQQQQEAIPLSSRIVAPRMLGEIVNGRFGHLRRHIRKKKQAGTTRIQIKCPSR